MIDLAIGHPSTRLLATKELAGAVEVVYRQLSDLPKDFADEDRHPLQYGTDAGPLSVRQVIADWYTRNYALDYAVDPDLLCITCGASAGLGNTCLQLTDPQYTRRIFIMTPAYFLAAKIFQDAGYQDKMYAINEAGNGFDVEQLQAVLTQDEQNSRDWPAMAVLAGKRYKYLFYAVPTFSNPSGITWDLQSRRALLDLARKHDILIITDEVYDFLDYKHDLSVTPPINRIVDLDIQTRINTLTCNEFGNSISNMSFSKYLGPGLRIGTIQCASRKLADQWSSGGANHSGGAMAQHTSYYVAELIRIGSLDRVLHNLRSTYAGRADAIMHALAREMPSGCQIHGGAGGYFIWISLPDHSHHNVESVLDYARSKYGVHVLPGSACEVPGFENKKGWARRCMRISLSKLETADAIEGIRRLGAAFRDDAEK